MSFYHTDIFQEGFSLFGDPSTPPSSPLSDPSGHTDLSGVESKAKSLWAKLKGDIDPIRGRRLWNGCVRFSSNEYWSMDRHLCSRRINCFSYIHKFSKS